MDVALPYRAIAPTLDVGVLVELYRMPEPVSIPKLRQQLGHGSDRGLRLATERLVAQGLVKSQRIGNMTLYNFNNRHLAAPAVQALAGMRSRLLDQLRQLIDGWEVEPMHASLFGSAARRDGGPESDIDLLVVRPAKVDEDDERWRAQIGDLEDQVEAWTGNHAQVAEIAATDVAELRRRRPAIVDDLRRDGIDLGGITIRELLDPGVKR